MLSGRVRPEAYGLPPFDPSRIGLSLPAIAVPEVRLPRAPLPPLGIEAEAVRRSLPGDRQVWEIAGTIRNPTERRQQVPPVEILLLDAGGGVVGRWTVRPEAQQVAPGSAVRFETSAIDPPPAATVSIRTRATSKMNSNTTSKEGFFTGRLSPHLTGLAIISNCIIIRIGEKAMKR